MILQRLPEELENRLRLEPGTCFVKTGDHIHFEVEMTPPCPELPHHIALTVSGDKVEAVIQSQIHIRKDLEPGIRRMIHEIVDRILAEYSLAA